MRNKTIEERAERVYPSKYLRGRQKKGDAWKKVRRPGVVREKSELEAEAELHAAGEVCAAGVQEARRADATGISGCRANRRAVHTIITAVRTHDVILGVVE